MSERRRLTDADIPMLYRQLVKIPVEPLCAVNTVLNCFQTFSVKSGTGVMVSKPSLSSMSRFITYLLLELVKHEGLIDEVDPELKEAYDKVFSETR